MSYSRLDSAIDTVGQRVLVCPLNWGLGHASRCIPLVRKLCERGKTVIIAADGEAKALLQYEFPDIQIICFSSFTIKYGKGNSQIMSMLKALPKILLGIVKEHQRLKRIVRRLNIQTVISDNRFGLWHSTVQSIYITHQLMVKMPKSCAALEPIVWRLHGCIIRRYAQCWIPDMPDKGNLSGDLAHKYPLPKNAQFIGFLSRFDGIAISDKPSPYKYLAVMSGPEPQRTLFEKSMRRFLKEQNEPSLLVIGRPSEKNHIEQCGKLTVKTHLALHEAAWLLSYTPHIYCRSGYSTLMDLVILGRTATIVATPGQTEQEYLAAISKAKGFNIVQQANI